MLGQALAAYAIGGLNVIGLFYIVYLRGGWAFVRQRNAELEQEVAVQKEKWGRLAAEVQKMQQPYQIHIGDEQRTAMATAIINRIEEIIAVREAATFNKMN